MTTYQELMLSVCFGATMGYLLFGLGMMLHEAVYFIKKKSKHTRKRKISRTLMTMKGQVTINEYGIA